MAGKLLKTTKRQPAKRNTIKRVLGQKFASTEATN